MPNSLPVIVIPGVTANYLYDHYPVSPELLWGPISLQRHYERASLHPDNRKYEAIEPARVLPGQLFEIAYKQLIDELRYNLSSSDADQVPVYAFSYDWRQPLEPLRDQLHDFITEVIERTKLMKNYHPEFAKNPKVNIVGHSMGGLIAAGYLKKYGDGSRINKVVSLGTPFQGSHEAIIKITTGTANLGTSAPSSREREAARMTPSLYYLLPHFDGALMDEAGASQDIFDVKVWQKSVKETIAAYIKKHSVTNQTGNFLAHAEDTLKDMLEAARAYRESINSLELSDAGLEPDDWLCVVGVDSTTRFRVRIRNAGMDPDFEFKSADRENLWGQSGKDKERESTGDGTVPYQGALPKFIDAKKLVCVTPDDFGSWEIQDIALTKLAGFHGIMPNMNMLHRLIVRFFTNRLDDHGNTWGRRPPGIAPKDWAPPLNGGLRDKAPGSGGRRRPGGKQQASLP